MFGNLGFPKTVCNKNFLDSNGVFFANASCERSTRISGIISSGMLRSDSSDDTDMLKACHERDIKSDEAKTFNENFNQEAFNNAFMELCQGKRKCHE
jgi:hypothetical protein